MVTRYHKKVTNVLQKHFFFNIRSACLDSSCVPARSICSLNAIGVTQIFLNMLHMVSANCLD